MLDDSAIEKFGVGFEVRVCGVMVVAEPAVMIDSAEIEPTARCLSLLRPCQAWTSRAAEVEIGFDEETAMEEAKRCLRCDLEWLEVMHLTCEDSACGKETEVRS